MVQNDMFCHALSHHILLRLLPMWLFPRSDVWYFRLEQAMSLWYSKVVSFSFFFIQKGENQVSKWDLCFPPVQSCCRRRWAEPGFIHGGTLTVKSSCPRVPLICSAVLLSLCRGRSEITSFEWVDNFRREKDGRSLCICSLRTGYTQTRCLHLKHVRTASASLALSRANCSVHSTLLQ